MMPRIIEASDLRTLTAIGMTIVILFAIGGLGWVVLNVVQVCDFEVRLR